MDLVIAVDVRTVAWVALATLAAVLAVMWSDYYATERDDQAQTVETTRAVDDLLDRELSTITPASTTTTEPESTTTEPPPVWDRETLEGLVRTVFPEDPDTAVRIVTAESGWNPSAVSRTDDHGLFQINAVHLRPLGVAWGYTRTDLLDPIVNLRVARAVYDDAGGWTPWTTY